MKAKGIMKHVCFKKEQEWGIAPLASDIKATNVRRVSSEFNTEVQVFESQEIRTSQQILDLKLGVSQIGAALVTDLHTSGNYEWTASLLGKDFSASTPAELRTISLASTTNDLYNITCSEVFFKTGDIIDLVDTKVTKTLNPDNEYNRLVVISNTVSLDISTLKVKSIGSTVLTNQSNITSVLLRGLGVKSFVPLTNHTDDSYTFEEWYSDAEISTVYSGMKFTEMQISAQPNSFCQVSYSLIGRENHNFDENLQLYQNPELKNLPALVAGNDVKLYINDNTHALCISDLQIVISRNAQAFECIGSSQISGVNVGGIHVRGTMQFFFEDSLLFDLQEQEQQTSLLFTLAEGQHKEAKAISIYLPAVRFFNFSKSDNETSILATCEFVALIPKEQQQNKEQTTIQIVDSGLNLDLEIDTYSVLIDGLPIYL